MENWHRTYKHFNHNKALYVQTWYPFSTDHFGKKKKNPIQTLKHTYSFIHTETHENFSFWLHQHRCWEQYICLFKFMAPFLFCFQLEVGRNNLVVNNMVDTHYCIFLKTYRIHNTQGTLRAVDTRQLYFSLCFAMYVKLLGKNKTYSKRKNNHCLIPSFITY